MTSVACIGAGPAGLTAAYLLRKQNVEVTVLEKDPVYVGGISRTVRYKGFCFDIGGHRFFSKSAEVEQLWDEILGNDFIERPRKSRIYYNKKFYPYPLEAWTTLSQMGVFRSAACVLSYLKARLFPIPNPANFEDWVINRFGKKLYLMFFKTYTEKVWGMDCRDISADWAAQRIKGLSLSSAIRHALTPRFLQPKGSKVIKTLIHSFRYPRLGPGMMWEKAESHVTRMGGTVIKNASVSRVLWEEAQQHWRIFYQDADRQVFSITSDHVISSMPLRELVQIIDPPLPKQVIDAANRLAYRDFLIVALVVKDRNQFDDNWIYIHEPHVKVGRIQNFKSWSPEMVPDPSLNCFGMEYFCFEHDGLWKMPDAELAMMATRELVSLGLAKAEDVLDACVVRQHKAYPVYDEEYATHVQTIRDALHVHKNTLHVVGRAGMHKYNNQDHAMMTAMLTVKNILGATPSYDVWNVNQDAEYHEESTADSSSGLRQVPRHTDAKS